MHGTPTSRRSFMAVTSAFLLCPFTSAGYLLLESRTHSGESGSLRCNKDEKTRIEKATTNIVASFLETMTQPIWQCSNRKYKNVFAGEYCKETNVFGKYVACNRVIIVHVNGERTALSNWATRRLECLTHCSFQSILIKMRVVVAVAETDLLSSIKIYLSQTWTWT